MKGQTGIELAVIAIMMLVGVMVLFLPTLFYHFSSQINIQYQYHYDNAQSLLLSMLPTTVTDSLTGTTKSSFELLGEYLQLSTKPDITPVNDKLSTLTNGINVNCYELSASSLTIQSSSTTSMTSTSTSSTTTPSTTNTATTTDIISGQCTKYQASATITLPYNPGNLVKTITLVIEQ